MKNLFQPLVSGSTIFRFLKTKTENFNYLQEIDKNHVT